MEDPKEYDTIKTTNPNFSAIYDNAAEFLVKSLAWKDGDVVMDYGCGSGHFAFNYLGSIEKSLKIYGVDISSTMVEFAKSNYSRDNIEFSVGNILDNENWTFLSSSVDKFVSHLVLCYIQDYKSFISSIYDLMRPGGQVAFLVPISRAYGIPYKLFSGEKWSEYEKAEKSRIASWVYEIENGFPDFKSEFESQGFKIKEFEIEDSKLGFENLYGFCDFLSVISASASRVPKERRKELMQDLESTAIDYLTITSPSNVAIDVDWKFLKIVAEK